MGQPGYVKHSHREELTRRTETSKYPEEEKIINDSDSSGERSGNSPNQFCFGKTGVVGLNTRIELLVEQFGIFGCKG